MKRTGVKLMDLLLTALKLKGLQPGTQRKCSLRSPLRRRVASVVVITAIAASAQVNAFDTATPPELAIGTLQAAFSPWDDIEGLITQSIAGARKQVLVQAYLLTSRPIASALIAARQRGIDVRVLVDQDQLKKNDPSRVAELVAADIPVWMETKYRSAHNKVVVIDAESVDASLITGSFNFTWSAQHKNAENVLIVRHNPVLAQRYALNWQRHWRDATPYKP
nr:phospholipase D family protein [Glaciimonas immobilis]